jgi:outer membrane immunogenic protein
MYKLAFSRAVLTFSLIVMSVAGWTPNPAEAQSTYNWTGCYAGINGGWARTASSTLLMPTGTYLNPAGFFAPPNAEGTGALLGDQQAVTDRGGTSASGFAGGGQLGCNKQVDNLVLGIEGDFNGAAASSTATASFGAVPSSNPLFTVSPHTDTLSNSLNWYSTIRARIGYVWDPVMLYATAGLAITNNTSSTSVNFGTSGTSPVYAGASHSGSGSFTKVGGAIGAGGELPIFGNWTVKAEYLHIAVNGGNYNSALTAPAGVAPGYTWNTNLAHVHDDVIRIGINYKFY